MFNILADINQFYSRKELNKKNPFSDKIVWTEFSGSRQLVGPASMNLISHTEQNSQVHKEIGPRTSRAHLWPANGPVRPYKWRISRLIHRFDIYNLSRTRLTSWQTHQRVHSILYIAPRHGRRILMKVRKNVHENGSHGNRNNQKRRLIQTWNVAFSTSYV